MNDLKIITHKYNDYIFYEIRNVLDKSHMDIMKKDIDYEIENFLEERVAKYQTKNYLHKRYKFDPAWRYFFDSCNFIVKEIFSEDNYCTIETKKCVGCWANVSKPDSNFFFHQHQNDVKFSIVYYLKNPSEVYGTMFQDGDCEVIIGGKENSLILFDSANITHKTLSPPPQVSKDTPRYTIAVDFGVENSINYKYN
jgi:hypothetical protein